MGKATKQRRSLQKKNDTINNSSTSAEVEIDLGDLKPIVSKLSAVNASDRAWAAVCVSNLFAEDRNALNSNSVSSSGNIGLLRKQFFAGNIIGRLIDLLVDSSSDVILEASGALRNLAASGDDGIIKELHGRHIMTALKPALQKLSTTASDVSQNGVPVSDASTDVDMDSNSNNNSNEDGGIETITPAMEKAAAAEHVWNITENILNIISLLSDASDAAFGSVNTAVAELIPFVISLLNSSNTHVPDETVLAAAQCLYAVSDGNKLVAGLVTVQQPTLLSSLVAVFTMAGHSKGLDARKQAQILIGGSLRNIRAEAGPNDNAAVIPEDLDLVLVQTISGFLDVDMSQLVSEATPLIQKVTATKASRANKAASAANTVAPQSFAALATAPQQKKTGDGEATDDQDSIVHGAHDLNAQSKEEQRLTGIENRLSQMHTCLELLTNIFADANADIAELADDGNIDMDDNDNEDSIMMAPTGSNHGGEDDMQMVVDDMRHAVESDRSLAALAADVPATERALMEAFTALAIPRLVRLFTPTQLSFPAQGTVIASAEDVPSLTIALGALHVRALHSLGNFLLGICNGNEAVRAWWFRTASSSNEGVTVDALWNALFAVAGAAAGEGVAVGAEPLGHEARGEVLDAVVGCLFALALGMRGNVSAVTDGHLHALVGCIKSAVITPIKAKAIGALGQLARRQPGFIESNRFIGEFLMSAISAINAAELVRQSKEYQRQKLTNSTTLKCDPLLDTVECATEALDAIMDIYGDAAFDYDAPVFVALGFNATLQKVLPQMRTMIRSVSAQKHQQLRQRADNVISNLDAFIQYKKSERR
ncbi:hypothetical protein GQ42DRAFT_48777 [Ramicandelaber brevisporus]|nr:hypothetical protein GQ42DRAFT_48777 [Ramicandelaber brevisporus]